MPPPGDLPDPGVEPMCLMPPALAGRFFTTVTPGKPISTILYYLKKLSIICFLLFQSTDDLSIGKKVKRIGKCYSL